MARADILNIQPKRIKIIADFAMTFILPFPGSDHERKMKVDK